MRLPDIIFMVILLGVRYQGKKTAIMWKTRPVCQGQAGHTAGENKPLMIGQTEAHSRGDN